MKINVIKQNAGQFSIKNSLHFTDKQNSKNTREHLEDNLGISNLNNQGRLSEYELDKLIKSLVLVKPKASTADIQITKTNEQETTSKEVDEDILMSAGLWNLMSLYGDNSYRAGLNDITPKQVEIIKQSGIEHIVDLRSHASKEDFKDIDYLNFRVFDVFNMRGDFCSELVKFVQTMQKGNVLLGCEFGTKNSDYAQRINYLFNPKAHTMPKRCGRGFDYDMEDIYYELSDQNKKDMGWNEEFDKNFLKKLKTY